MKTFADLLQKGDRKVIDNLLLLKVPEPVKVKIMELYDSHLSENPMFPEYGLKKVRAKKFEPPTEDEVRSYFLENGYSEWAASKAWRHYELGHWTDASGKPVKNWKQKMHTNWFKDENKLGNNGQKQSGSSNLASFGAAYDSRWKAR